MTDHTDRIDQRIRTYLRQPHTRDYPPTIGDIYDTHAIPTSSIRAAIRRLQDAGEVEPAGEAANGGRTWRLTHAAYAQTQEVTQGKGRDDGPSTQRPAEPA